VRTSGVVADFYDEAAGGGLKGAGYMLGHPQNMVPIGNRIVAGALLRQHGIQVTLRTLLHAPNQSGPMIYSSPSFLGLCSPLPHFGSTWNATQAFLFLDP
jgi:hypothetical protein